MEKFRPKFGLRILAEFCGILVQSQIGEMAKMNRIAKAIVCATKPTLGIFDRHTCQGGNLPI